MARHLPPDLRNGGKDTDELILSSALPVPWRDALLSALQSGVLLNAEPSMPEIFTDCTCTMHAAVLQLHRSAAHPSLFTVPIMSHLLDFGSKSSRQNSELWIYIYIIIMMNPLPFGVARGNEWVKHKDVRQRVDFKCFSSFHNNRHLSPWLHVIDGKGPGRSSCQHNNVTWQVMHWTHWQQCKFTTWKHHTVNTQLTVVHQLTVVQSLHSNH